MPARLNRTNNPRSDAAVDGSRDQGCRRGAKMLSSGTHPASVLSPPVRELRCVDPRTHLVAGRRQAGAHARHCGSSGVVRCWLEADQSIQIVDEAQSFASEEDRQRSALAVLDQQFEHQREVQHGPERCRPTRADANRSKVDQGWMGSMALQDGGAPVPSFVKHAPDLLRRVEVGVTLQQSESRGRLTRSRRKFENSGIAAGNTLLYLEEVSNSHC